MLGRHASVEPANTTIFIGQHKQFPINGGVHQGVGKHAVIDNRSDEHGGRTTSKCVTNTYIHIYIHNIHTYIHNTCIHTHTHTYTHTQTPHKQHTNNTQRLRIIRTAFLQFALRQAMNGYGSSDRCHTKCVVKIQIVTRH